MLIHKSWDFIGGPGTFDELLAIVEDGHQELHTKIHRLIDDAVEFHS